MNKPSSPLSVHSTSAVYLLHMSSACFLYKNPLRTPFSN